MSAAISCVSLPPQLPTGDVMGVSFCMVFKQLGSKKSMQYKSVIVQGHHLGLSCDNFSADASPWSDSLK